MLSKPQVVSNRQELLQDLETLVNLDSPSHDAEAMNKMSSIIEEELEQIGCQVIRHGRAGGDILQANLGQGEKQILLLAHMDTVFPRGTAANHPFKIEQGKAYGPGVLDMKSGVVMLIELFRTYAQHLPEDWSLCGLFTADEEVGSLESKNLIESLARQSRLCLCLEPSKPTYCTVKRKGMLSFSIEVRGASAHSGVNYQRGHSAIKAISRIICNLYKLVDLDQGVTVNVGSITGGSGKTNIVAEYAQMQGEIRYPSEQKGEELWKKIKAYSSETGDPHIQSELKLLTKRPPLEYTEESQNIFNLAKKAAQENDLNLIPRFIGGGSDGSFASQCGIPVLDGLGAEGEHSHTFEEYIDVTTFEQRMNLLVDLVYKILKT